MLLNYLISNKFFKSRLVFVTYIFIRTTYKVIKLTVALVLCVLIKGLRKLLRYFGGRLCLKILLIILILVLQIPLKYLLTNKIKNELKMIT